MTDANGCKSQPECYAVGVFDPLPNSIVVEAIPESPNCNGGFGTLNAYFQPWGNYAPPLIWEWNNGSTSPLSTNVDISGYYSLTITDGCGNTSSIGMQYDIVDRPVTIDLVIDDLCQLPTSITATATHGGGGYSYLWNTGEQTSAISASASGTYTVTITSIIGCTTSQSIAVFTSPLSISGVSHNVSFGDCNDGRVVLYVEGGEAPYTFQWNGPNGYQSSHLSISNLNVGTYCVTVSDANLCSSVRCFTVGRNNFIGISNVVNVSSCTVNSLDCVGALQTCAGSIMLAISGGSTGYSYQWSNGSTTMNLSGLCIGTYTVTITNTSGCTQTLTATICCCYTSYNGPNQFPYCSCSYQSNQFPPPLNVGITNIVAPQNTTSNDGAINIDLTGQTGTVYFHWIGPNGYHSFNRDITNLGPGIYCLTVTNGCSSSSTCTSLVACSTISVNTIKINKDCTTMNAGAISLSISGGNLPISYAWSNGKTTLSIDNLKGGTYTLSVSDNAGCTLTKSYTVPQTAIDAITYGNCFIRQTCGSLVRVINIPVEPIWTDCNTSAPYCSANGQIVGSPSQWPPLSLLDVANCVLTCGNGFAHYATQRLEDVILKDEEAGECQKISGCVFENIYIFGKFQPTYLVKYKVDVQNLVVLNDCYYNCNQAGTLKRPRLTCFGLIFSGENCSCPQLTGDEDSFLRGDQALLPPKMPILSDYVAFLKDWYGFSEVGVHVGASPEMALSDYNDLLNKDSSVQIPIVPFDYITKQDKTKNNIFIYPNPFEDWFIVKSARYFEVSELTLLNAFNERLFSTAMESEETTIHVQNLPSGAYWLHCKYKNGGYDLKKLLKFSQN